VKIAIPLAGGKLSQHFGHCDQFSFFTVEDQKILGSELLSPPEHVPGSFPKWVKEEGASVVIAGGMGRRAVDLFKEAGVEVVSGALCEDPQEIVEQYLKGELEATGGDCGHTHTEGCNH